MECKKAGCTRVLPYNIRPINIGIWQTVVLWSQGYQLCDLKTKYNLVARLQLPATRRINFNMFHSWRTAKIKMASSW